MSARGRPKATSSQSLHKGGRTTPGLAAPLAGRRSRSTEVTTSLTLARALSAAQPALLVAGACHSSLTAEAWRRIALRPPASGAARHASSESNATSGLRLRKLLLCVGVLRSTALRHPRAGSEPAALNPEDRPTGVEDSVAAALLPSFAVPVGTSDNFCSHTFTTTTEDSRDPSRAASTRSWFLRSASPAEGRFFAPSIGRRCFPGTGTSVGA
mmetsp:Transcript_49524/g.130536  ORF Transcript_49524/g.130536 Transcript_49524/m.130536 type:complete len:213 (-) Transcript_49524:1611-2249(-)